MSYDITGEAGDNLLVIFSIQFKIIIKFQIVPCVPYSIVIGTFTTHYNSQNEL